MSFYLYQALEAYCLFSKEIIKAHFHGHMDQL